MGEFWLLVELHQEGSVINRASLSSYAATTDDDAVAALATDACNAATEIAAPDVANTSAVFLLCANATASAPNRELTHKCPIGDKMPNWAFQIVDWGLEIEDWGIG